METLVLGFLGGFLIGWGLRSLICDHRHGI